MPECEALAFRLNCIHIVPFAWTAHFVIDERVAYLPPRLQHVCFTTNKWVTFIALLHQNCDKIWLVLSAFTFMNSGPVWPSQVICAAFCCEAQMQFEVHPSFGCDQFFHIERCCAGRQDCVCFSLWLRANFILLIRMCLPFELDHIYLRASIVLPLTFGNSFLVQARGIFICPWP